MALASARDRTQPVTLTESATLPGAGAFEAVPVTADMITIPSEKLTATIAVSYTRGGSGGKASHKVYLGDGTRVFQVMSSDGSYDGDDGAPSTGAGAILYSITVRVEVGNTGSPGSYSTTVTFQ